MKTFRTVYNWAVLEKIQEGKKVCVVDKQFHSCDTLNELIVDEAIAILKSSEECEDRYDFWIEEESEEVENEQS